MLTPRQHTHATQPLPSFIIFHSPLLSLLSSVSASAREIQKPYSFLSSSLARAGAPARAAAALGLGSPDRLPPRRGGSLLRLGCALLETTAPARLGSAPGSRSSPSPGPVALVSGAVHPPRLPLPLPRFLARRAAVAARHLPTRSLPLPARLGLMACRVRDGSGWVGRRWRHPPPPDLLLCCGEGARTAGHGRRPPGFPSGAVD